MSRLTPLFVAFLVVLLSGCAPAATGQPMASAIVTLSPSPDPTPGVTSSEAMPTDGTQTQPPTTAPTPPAFVVGGTWVKPGAGATLTSYTTTLSATPTATGDGVTTVTKVVFEATWAGSEKAVACEATRPAENGAWRCRANLLSLGVPPGIVTFSFDVVGVGVPIARSPDGLRQVTYAVPPPRPTNTRLQQLEQPDLEGGDNSAILHRVRWSAPAGYADEFLVYETFECPRPSTEETRGEPCFIAGTPVDTSRLELRATASGDARSVKIHLTEFECGPSHGTILLRARNAYGESVFAIVEAAPIIWVAPNDMIC